MKKILILTISEGHVSIAQAIKKSLENSFQTEVVAYTFKEFNLYLPMYQLFPALFKIPYRLSQYKAMQELSLGFFLKKYGPEIEKIIEDEKPDVLVSTYALYDVVCTDYAKKHHIPVFNALANPRTIHPLEICENSTKNLVFDEEAYSTLVKFGIPKGQILKTGWFVRPSFKPVRSKEKLRKELGLKPDILTYLVCGGSDGTGMVVKILPLLFQINSPLQLIFITGNNKSLFRSLQFFKKSFYMANKNSSMQIKVFGFVSNIYDYMAASDLVIGKAGPNSLFESVAVHTPFFAITHISGQEDGNLDLIREYKLGYVEENPLKAIKMLKTIAENPKRLSRFQKSLQLMAEYNQQAGEQLRTVIHAALSSP